MIYILHRRNKNSRGFFQRFVLEYIRRYKILRKHQTTKYFEEKNVT